MITIIIYAVLFSYLNILKTTLFLEHFECMHFDKINKYSELYVPFEWRAFLHQSLPTKNRLGHKKSKPEI